MRRYKHRIQRVLCGKATATRRSCKCGPELYTFEREHVADACSPERYSAIFETLCSSFAVPFAVLASVQASPGSGAVKGLPSTHGKSKTIRFALISGSEPQPWTAASVSSLAHERMPATTP
eukprot:scaffold820_cov376-Prasinococcus_capsulatus_cf.AAC.25